jgi:hypothetical protein
MLMDQQHITRSYKLKWLLIVFVIKSALFLFLAHEFYHYAKSGLVKSWIVVEQADSISYYNPAQLFVEQGWYAGICRMPGLLPQYALFAWPFGHQSALMLIILLQFVFSVISTVLLAIVASRIIPHKMAFPATALTYAASSFVSVWDHTMLSDSFAASSMIFALYYLSEYCTKDRIRYLVLAGCWLTWSVFTRQIIILFLPVFPLLWWVWRKDPLRVVIKNAFVFSIPVIILFGCWIIRNYKEEGVFIPLIKPIAKCWTTYTPQFMKINELLIAWGEDVQYWIKGTPAEWFGSLSKQQKVYEFRSEVNTGEFNADSILVLQHRYVDFRLTNDTLEKKKLGEHILRQTSAMLEAYKSEHKTDYLFFNRIRLIKDFLFPLRLDNTPGPAFDKMNVFQKLFKIGYYVLLLFVNTLGILSILYAIVKRDKTLIVWLLMPVTMVVVLAGIMGFIEQRYLVPVYPLFLVSALYLILSMHARYFRAYN